MNKMQILNYWAERFANIEVDSTAFNIISSFNSEKTRIRIGVDLSKERVANAMLFCEQKNICMSAYHTACLILALATLTGKKNAAVLLHTKEGFLPVIVNVDRTNTMCGFVAEVEQLICEARNYSADFSYISKYLDEDGVQYKSDSYLHFYLDEEADTLFDYVQVDTANHSFVLQSSSVEEKKANIFVEMFELIFDNLQKEVSLNTASLLSLERYQTVCNCSYGDKNCVSDYICLGEIVRSIADKYKNEIALITDDTKITYGELFAAVQTMTANLIQKGVTPGTRCAILCRQDFDTVVIILSLLYIGAIIIPLDKKYPPAKLKSSKEIIGIEKVFASETVPLIDDLLVLKADFRNNDIYVEPVHNEDMYITFTSGTTGTPKAIKITCREFYNLHLWYSNTLDLKPGARNALLTSFGFDATIKNIVSPLLVGATLVLVCDELYDIKSVIQSISKHEVTHINCVPSLLHEVLKYSAVDNFKQLSSVLVVALGGEKFPNAIAREWAKSSYFNARLLNVYGPAEGTDLSVYYTLEDDDINGDGAIPIGRPVSNRQVFVFDEDMNLCSVDEKGELYISGIGVIESYVDKRDNSDKFSYFYGLSDSILYRTGDVVYWNGNGQLMHSGRSDNQIKYNGQRIEIEELETVIEKCDSVDKCMVKVVKENDKVDRLVAFYTLKTNCEIAPAEVRKYCLQWINASMVPSYFVPVDDIPLTANGKIDRSWAPKISMAVEQNKSRNISDTEKRVLEIWEVVLSNKVPDIETPFFEVGGNSLLLTRLQQEITEAFDVEISVLDLMELATIKGISKYIEEEE